MNSGRILVLLPLHYVEGAGFWERDAGLLVIALRALGHDAHLVALGASAATRPTEQPLILATEAALFDPAWWKSQQPDAVILNLWNATRWEGIRAAARQATHRLIEKTDTDGVRSPAVWFGQYLLDTWSAYRDSASVSRRLLAAPLALARSCLLRAFPHLLDRRLAAGMARVPLLAVETPIALQRLRRFIVGQGEKVPRMLCIPHAVDESQVGLDPAIARENSLISVGRWDAHQKNFPLLLRTVGEFLGRHPDWTADIVGTPPKDLESRTRKIPPGSLSRIRFLGRLTRGELGTRYRSSRIFVMTSRYESFNLAAAEALCCGCSVVGPAKIASIPFFTSRASGTAACGYSAMHLGDALGAEAETWKLGGRDPAQISSDWLKIVGSRVVAGQIVQAIETLQA